MRSHYRIRIIYTYTRVDNNKARIAGREQSADEDIRYELGCCVAKVLKRLSGEGGEGEDVVPRRFAKCRKRNES